MIYRLSLVGHTAMAAGHDAWPFLDTLPVAVEAAWKRLEARQAAQKREVDHG